MRTAFAWLPVLCLAFLGACGGGKDGPECTIDGFACAADEDCCTGNCDASGVCIQDGCLDTGAPCADVTDCCGLACVDFVCSDDQCTADGTACSSDGECCSGACDGTCQPLNPNCKTSGNPCTNGGECCSSYCVDGLCDAHPSYCTVAGDACSTDHECCGGFCSKVGDAPLGTCQLVPASGAGGCLSAGEVCGGAYVEGELPLCGGECCSRACFPYGPSGILICQPPSGCRPTGEICQTDHDCCGSAEQPDGDSAMIICEKEGDNPFGRCTQGNACTPAGGICRMQDYECNANANCCAGNVLQFDTCAQDNLGIPRCLAAEVDCTDPSQYEGQPCATSADCCGLPCTPSSNDELAPLVCGGDACQPTGGTCTTSADCCSTQPCVFPPDASVGTCGESGDCAEYGQTCDDTIPCCNDVPCTNGVCGVVVP